MKVLNKILKQHLPSILEDYKVERRDDSRFDSKREFEEKLRNEMLKISDELGIELEKFDLKQFIDKVAGLTRKQSVNEWRRIVRDSLGIDIMEDYYMGEFFAQHMNPWVSDNISRIKSLPQETLGRMQEIILDGYSKGSTLRTIQRAIQEEYNVSKRDAQLLARDQVATLNARITRQQQTDAGCEEYKWSDSGDSRVRECHRSLNGKIFRWDDPPEMWYMTKSRGKVYTGRKCHPGEDICCRCCAIPVFKFDNLNIPMAGEKK